MTPLLKQHVENTDRRAANRRKHPRALVDWPVTLIAAKGSYQGKAENISRGGALIHTTEELGAGENVRLAFEVPDFQDVIVARGEILRVFPLKRSDEQQFSHGIALEFTEISEDNLRFFTGNLAPEWKDGYQDSGPIQKTKTFRDTDRNMRSLGWLLAFILLLPITYFLYDSVQRKIDADNSITQIEKKLLIIEAQINAMQDSVDSYESVVNQIDDLLFELSKLSKNLPSAGALERMNQQIQNHDQQIQIIHKRIEQNKEPASLSSTVGNTIKQDHYYVVKGGDNLTQISLKTGITIQELREINDIDADNTIFPGQKLKLE